MNNKTPMKAIRMKCLQCCCNSSNEVKGCTVTGCGLYPYRFGHRPTKSATFSEIETVDEEIIEEED